MSVVWCAMDQLLGERVAIKVLKDSTLIQAGGGVAFREAKALFQLTHRNVVRLRTLESSGEAEPQVSSFLVMEYLEGLDLDSLVLQRLALGDECRLEADDLRWIARQIGAALDYAHEMEVLHRDIKPANMLFDRKFSGALGASGAQLKLADFGIARVFKTTTQTHRNKVQGTPPYMAPELFLGESASVQSDLYALSATLYFALHGRPPFPATEILPDLLGAPVPSLRSGDEGLDTAVKGGLAKDPRHRPESVRDWLALMGESFESGAPSPRLAVRGRGGHLLSAFDSSPTGVVPLQLVFWLGSDITVCADPMLPLYIHNPLPTEVEYSLEAEIVGATDVSYDFIGGEGRVGAQSSECSFMQITGTRRCTGAVRLRLRVRQSDQPDCWYAFETPASGIPFNSDGEVLRLGLREAPEGEPWHAMRLTLPAGHRGARPHIVPLVRAEPAHGVQLTPRPTGSLRHYVLDIWEGERLHSRTHLYFQRELYFGRQIGGQVSDSHIARQHNDVVVRYLPIRSANLDPENWESTRHIHRRLCSLRMDAKKSTLTARFPGPSEELWGPEPHDRAGVERSQAAPAQIMAMGERYIHRGQPLELPCGPIERPLRLRFKAFRFDGWSRETPKLLQKQGGFSSISALNKAPYHSTVLCERVGNAEEIRYALVADWASVGGGSEDAVACEGLPTGCLRFVNHVDTPFVLAGSPVSGFRPSETKRRVWSPLAEGGRGTIGAFEFELSPGSSEAMAGELDLLVEEPRG